MMRRLDFDGLWNFRDFGGYATARGAPIKRGRFFRSAHHGRATDEDLAKLAALGIEAVIDLRRPSERANQPSRRWETFAADIIENHEEEEGGHELWHDFIRRPDLTTETFRAYLVQFYRNLPWAPRHVDLFSRYFETLATREGPLLVHCSGGKDRTGTLVALTHTLAGVHRDDIIADYLATNDSVRFERDGAMVADGIAELRGGDRPSAELLRLIMGVERDWLETAFREIETRHGGVEAYVRDVLGVDAKKRAAIEKRLFD